MRFVILAASHVAALVIGFALGVYFLPILTAPQSPDAEMLSEKAQEAEFSGTFTRDLAGSDFLHWGEGTISLSPTEIVHIGALSPGPDFRLYLTTSFVEDEAGFEAIKDSADYGSRRKTPALVRAGDEKSKDCAA